MGFAVPLDWSEVREQHTFRDFVLAPISPIWNIPMYALIAAGYEEDELPVSVDTGENVRNTLIWFSMASAVWGYNYFVHAGAYAGFPSGGSALAMAARTVAGPVLYFSLPLLAAKGHLSAVERVQKSQTLSPVEKSSWIRSMSQALVGTGPGVGSWSP